MKEFEVSKAYIENYHEMVETRKIGERINDMYGGSTYRITKKQIYELLSGEFFLHMNDGEYFTVVALATEEGE